MKISFYHFKRTRLTISRTLSLTLSPPLALQNLHVKKLNFVTFTRLLASAHLPSFHPLPLFPSLFCLIKESLHLSKLLFFVLFLLLTLPKRVLGPKLTRKSYSPTHANCTSVRLSSPLHCQTLTFLPEYFLHTFLFPIFAFDFSSNFSLF